MLIERMQRRVLWIALECMVIVCILVAPARSETFEPISGFPDGTTSPTVSAISGDGSTIIGGYTDGALAVGYRWTEASGVSALAPDGYPTSYGVRGISYDGSVIVGGSYIWTAADGFQVITSGPLLGSSVYGVSGNGQFFVGLTDVSGVSHGYRYSQTGGMEVFDSAWQGSNLIMEYATGASYDGSVVIGMSLHGSPFITNDVWRWTETGGIDILETVPGYSSVITPFVSGDGSTVVGTAADFVGVNGSAWYRWTESDGAAIYKPVGLSAGTAVGGVNGDGTVMVGAGYATGAPHGVALRWTMTRGFDAIADLLAAGDVDIGDLVLDSARGVSANGSIIAGNGYDGGGDQMVWVAVCGVDSCRGLISPDKYAASFAGTGLVGKSTGYFMGSHLAGLQNIANQHTKGNSPWGFFGSGFYDSDPVGGADVGFTYDLEADRLVGLSIGESYIETPMTYDGVSRVWATTLGGFVAQNPDEGVQWFAGFSSSLFNGSNNREYQNGVSIVGSEGPVTGYGLGAQARAGYSFRAGDAFRFTPFTSFTLTKSHIDAYTEDTGPLPAHFDASDNNAQTLRLGSDARWTFASGTWAYGTLAFAHRTDDAKSSGVSGFIIGAFTVITPAAQDMRNWGEATIGARLPLGEGMSFNGSVTGITAESKYESSVQVRAGVTCAF